MKHTVFLFGAGATLAWNSPTTSELTNLIRQSGFKTADNQTFITEFIYARLLENGYTTNDINFETIISVLEELVIHYSQFNAHSKTPSLMSSFLTLRYESELLNYSILGGVPRHGYQLNIPKDVQYPFSKHSYHDETPSQFFFQQLLSVLLTNITARIHEYAYHTQSSSMESIDNDNSKAFVSWMKLLSEKRLLRLYTLNYERLFKILLARDGMDVFEGFDCDEFVERTMRANVPRILSDTQSHIHYNLHGSAFWEVLPLDKKQLPNPEIIMSPVFALPLTNDPACVQIEKGKTLLVTNMITGYQKAQRGMITPFKQMQSAFDRDCCLADEIYVVGYSFGDEHINESLKTALRHNNKLHITIVDPMFMQNRMDYKLATQLFPFHEQNSIRPRKVAEHLYTFFDGLVTVHEIGFKEFMDSQL